MIPMKNPKIPSWSLKRIKKLPKRALIASSRNWLNWATWSPSRARTMSRKLSLIAWPRWDISSILEGLNMSDGLIAPHGGELVINMASEAERAALQEQAKDLPQITVGSRALADLEMLAIGAYSPLG